MTQKPNYTLEKSADQPVWNILVDGTSVGRVQVMLEDTDYVAAPSLLMNFTNESYAGTDIEAAVIKDTIRYAYGNLPYAELYSRYYAADTARAAFLRKLGFEADDKPYTDGAGGEWQNIKLVL